MANGITTTRRRQGSMTGGDTLADILERVLDTGIVIAGDIRVQLADIELLTIQIRLIVCSVEKAQELGMDWWRTAPYLTANPEAHDEPPVATSDDATHRLEQLDDRLERLEATLAEIAKSTAEH